LGKGRVKSSSKFPEHPEFNNRLENIERDIKNLYRSLVNEGGNITPKYFKEMWEKHNKPNDTSSNSDFVEFVEKLITEAKMKYAPSTIKSYRNTLNHLQEFAKANRINLTFDNINADFHTDLIEYFKHEKKFAPNTIWGKNKNLKVFLNEAFERGLITNQNFRTKKFRVSAEETDVTYLNNVELEKIRNKDFSKTPYLDKARDLFLIGCYTGLRDSDLNSLKKENLVEFEGEKMLRVKVKKTNQNVTIPLHPIVTEIINKNNGQIPKGISNQKFNKYIKDVVKLADIKEPLSYHETRGNLSVTKTCQKWEKISSHTARRSFATNAYLAGVPTIAIMKITGHKTEKAFLRYIRVTNDENAMVIARHDFFRPAELKQVK
jgi:integrase